MDFENYNQREHAFVKHWILANYLRRLVMIVGQSFDRINFVDCYSGPWNHVDDVRLSDTSIGIALQELEKCKNALLLRRPGRAAISVNALFIEKETQSYEKLKTYLDNYSGPVSVHSINASFQDKLTDIEKFSANGFTFYFVDPKGWIGISPEDLAPLSRNRNSELLINFMSEFVGRFVGAPDQKIQRQMENLLGVDAAKSVSSSDDRDSTLVHIYREKLKSSTSLKSWASSMPVLSEKKDRTKYHLVYLTHAPKGIEVFRERVEIGQVVQRTTHQIALHRRKATKRVESTGISDMFGDMPLNNPVPSERESSVGTECRVRDAVLKRLGVSWRVCDLGMQADILEELDCCPADIQAAIKELASEGLIEVDASNFSRRRSYFLLFKDGERARLKG